MRRHVWNLKILPLDPGIAVVCVVDEFPDALHLLLLLLVALDLVVLLDPATLVAVRALLLVLLVQVGELPPGLELVPEAVEPGG